MLLLIFPLTSCSRASLIVCAYIVAAKQVRGMIPRKTARGEEALARLSVSLL